jgi:hypothetical protein
LPPSISQLYQAPPYPKPGGQYRVRGNYSFLCCSGVSLVLWSFNIRKGMSVEPKDEIIREDREVVGARHVSGGWEREEMIRCGKEGCRCARGELHGPYVYRYWREGGKMRSAYVSKAQRSAR